MINNISHGMNPDLDATRPIDREGTIHYQNGNSLHYVKDSASNSDERFLFDYHYHGKTTRLNDLIQSEKKWAMIPVESKFCIKLTKNGRVKPVPEIQLSIPELTIDEQNIICALHEIGHANLYENINRFRQSFDERAYDERLGILVTQEQDHAIQLVRTTHFFRDSFGEFRYDYFSERTAWAFALRARKKLKLFPNLDNPTLKKFYHKHLSTYSAYHDKDFTKSFRKARSLQSRNNLSNQ